MLDLVGIFQHKLLLHEEEWFQQHPGTPGSAYQSVWQTKDGLEFLRNLEAQYKVLKWNPTAYSIRSYLEEQNTIAKLWRGLQLIDWYAGTPIANHFQAADAREEVRVADCFARHFPGLDPANHETIDTTPKLWAWLTAFLIPSLLKTTPKRKGSSTCVETSIDRFKQINDLAQTLCLVKPVGYRGDAFPDTNPFPLEARPLRPIAEASELRKVAKHLETRVSAHWSQECRYYVFSLTSIVQHAAHYLTTILEDLPSSSSGIEESCNHADPDSATVEEARSALAWTLQQEPERHHNDEWAQAVKRSCEERPSLWPAIKFLDEGVRWESKRNADSSRPSQCLYTAITCLLQGLNALRTELSQSEKDQVLSTYSDLRNRPELKDMLAQAKFSDEPFSMQEMLPRNEQTLNRLTFEICDEPKGSPEVKLWIGNNEVKLQGHKDIRLLLKYMVENPKKKDKGRKIGRDAGGVTNTSAAARKINEALKEASGRDDTWLQTTPLMRWADGHEPERRRNAGIFDDKPK